MTTYFFRGNKLQLQVRALDEEFAVAFTAEESTQLSD